MSINFLVAHSSGLLKIPDKNPFIMTDVAKLEASCPVPSSII